MISTGGLDQCTLTYGYLPRGYNQLSTPRMLELRNACLARADEPGMRLPLEIDANIATLSGDTSYSKEDRALIADYCVKAYENQAIRSMKTD